MNITYNDGTKFHIKGDTKSVYVVDLEDNNRRGSCNCRQFKVRVQPQWNKGNKVSPCKHIIFCYGVMTWKKLHY